MCLESFNKWTCFQRAVFQGKIIRTRDLEPKLWHFSSSKENPLRARVRVCLGCNSEEFQPPTLGDPMQGGRLARNAETPCLIEGNSIFKASGILLIFLICVSLPSTVWEFKNCKCIVDFFCWFLFYLDSWMDHFTVLKLSILCNLSLRLEESLSEAIWK